MTEQSPFILHPNPTDHPIGTKLKLKYHLTDSTTKVNIAIVMGYTLSHPTCSEHVELFVIDGRFSAWRDVTKLEVLAVFSEVAFSNTLRQELFHLEHLCTKATRVADKWDLVVKDDGTERYYLMGVPCGFPVVSFGDAADAELDLEARRILPTLFKELRGETEEQTSSSSRTIFELDLMDGKRTIIQESDGSFRILLDGEDRHGVCGLQDVMSWFTNAMFNYNYMVKQHKSKMDSTS